MNPIRTLTLAVAAAVLLVAGALLGGIVSEAEAQIPPGCRSFGAGGITCPARPSTPTPEPTPEATSTAAPEGEGGGASESPEAVTCSLVAGCTIAVTDAEGVTVKVMHVTFTDAGEAEVSAE